MIKCGNGGCPENKEICCAVCENITLCGCVCDKNMNDCEDAINEGKDEIELFQNKAIVLMKSIAEIATAKKELEERDKVVREQLEKVMDEFGIQSFENDLLKISYVEPTTKSTIDSAKLKKKYPEIAEEMTKVSNVKGYVRIAVK